jgi:outer membrane protein/protease secretion system outer membrane protein
MLLQSPQPPLLEDWRRTAQDQSPEIASLKARLAAAQLAVERARGGHYPSLDAVAQVVRSSNENVTAPSSSYLNHTVGLQLNVPLYAGGYVNSVVRQAMAEQVRAQELYEATLRDLGLRVYREFRGVSEGVLRVQARKQALRSAEQLVESSRRSLQAGARTSLDVLNAEERKYLARRDLAQARYEYLMARIRLQSLAGGDKLRTLTEVNTWLREAQ